MADVEVATLKIPSPYTETTVARRNTFTWSKGRVVHELVAPDGKVYVMQSYAQIVDASLTLGQLGGLGSRLRLPGVWKYRNRRLRSDLTLRTNRTAKKAIIIQDELQDTYQLER